MLHLIYVLAFTIIAFLAISNLIRSLISLSFDSQRRYSRGASPSSRGAGPSPSLHPELLDETGKPTDEPLLVMRSVSLEDARQKLDDLYRHSPGQPQQSEED